MKAVLTDTTLLGGNKQHALRHANSKHLGNQILVGKGLVAKTKAEEIICIFSSRKRGRCFGFFLS